MSKSDISELILFNEIVALLVIARYYALNRFASLLSTRVDTEAFAVEGDRETIFDNIKDLISIASREALAYGYVLQVTNLSQTGDANAPVDQTGSQTTWGRDAWPTDWMVPGPITNDYGEFI